MLYRNRHIGASERRQLIPHVRFQVPFLGPESQLKSGFACAGLLCILNCFFSCKDRASERDRPYRREKKNVVRFTLVVLLLLLLPLLLGLLLLLLVLVLVLLLLVLLLLLILLLVLLLLLLLLLLLVLLLLLLLLLLLPKSYYL